MQDGLGCREVSVRYIEYRLRAITATTGVPRECAVGSILMLDPPKPRRLDQPIAVSLGALVP